MTPQENLQQILEEYLAQHGPLKTALMIAQVNREEFGGKWIIRWERNGKIVIEKVSNSTE